MRKEKQHEMSGLLGVGSRFEGEIRFDGTLRIDGDVLGLIICKSSKPSTVIITEMAAVEADIVADNVIISGTVFGNVKAAEKLELYAPGRLEGLVYTSDFSIEDGALFQGECIMIRHLSFEEKNSLKMEAFYTVHHHQRLLNQNRQNIGHGQSDVSLIEY